MSFRTVIVAAALLCAAGVGATRPAPDTLPADDGDGLEWNSYLPVSGSSPLAGSCSYVAIVMIAYGNFLVGLLFG